MNEDVFLHYWDGEKLLRMRSLAKRRKECIVELKKRIKELENQIDDREMSDYLREILG